MPIVYSFINNKGIKKKHNQDAIDVFKNKQGNLISVICDGVSSHNDSAYSSNYIVKELGKYWRNSNFKDITDVKNKIKNKIIDIDEYLNEKTSKMATTILISIIYEDTLLVLNVGDSLAYGITRSGEIELLSTDDSFAGVLLQSGVISKVEAKNHSKKNYLTQAIACGEKITIHENEVSINHYKYIVNSTDGLTNMLDIEEIKEVVIKNDLSRAVCSLVDEANSRGGIDNISISVFKNLRGDVYDK